jgi:HPt (histidine-containing phosphotransfer) domain-containing protein
MREGNQAVLAAVAANEPDAGLLDRSCIEEIRHIERVTGRSDVFSGFVLMLERNLGSFRAAFCDCVARGDAAGAARAAHTLKGACRQLGAQALGDLFDQIETRAKAGDYADAQRRFDGGAALIAQSLQALKLA